MALNPRRRQDPEGRYEERVDGITLEDASTFVASATPIIGDAMAAKEVYDELQKDDPNYYLAGALGGAAVIGLVPGLGDAAANAIRAGAKKAAETVKRVEVDPNALGSMGGNIRLKPKVNEDVVEAERLLDDPEALEQWRKENRLPESQRQKNPEGAKEAAGALLEGDITSKEARKRIKEFIPDPQEFTAEQVREMMPTVTEITGALGKKAKKYPVLGVKGADLKQGQVVSSRLDIPAYDDYDTWVVSIHDGNQKSGSVVGYGQAIRLKNINFGSDPKTALDIARGKRLVQATGEDAPKPQGKATIARIFGEYQSADPYDLQRQAADIIESGSDEWIQVGMNPYRGSAFYDKKTGMPVFEADEVIQVGPLVLAKNVKKPTISQMKEMAVRTRDGKIRMFNEGGMAMDEQTQMAFALGGSVEEVDPVSGNEVPPGSFPEEVRDDIDARLSEGEYVVPADVVRYYGVKFFEDLRTQAKSGFEDMEANGRIGGQPVPEENPLPFDVSELQVEEEPVQMNEGGFLDRDALESKFPASFMGSGGPAQEWKTFENEAGLTITIRFIDGKPMSVIPAGYTEVGARSSQTLEAPSVDRDNDDNDSPPPGSTSEPVDLSSLSADELEKLGDGTADAGILEKIVGYSLPLAGTAIRIGREMKAADVNAEIVKRLKSGKNLDGSPLTSADRARLGQIFDRTVDTEESGSGIFGGQRSLTEGLQDTSGDNQVSFADTFLGDLMGFDGGQVGIQATDKYGNKLGLDASISGKRRKTVEKPTASSGGGGNDNDGNDSSQPGPNFDGSAINSVTGTSWSDPDNVDNDPEDDGGYGFGSAYNYNKGGLMLKKDKKKK